MKEQRCVLLQFGKPCAVVPSVFHQALRCTCTVQLAGWLLPEFIVSLCSPKSKEMRLSHLSQASEGHRSASLCMATMGKAGEKLPMTPDLCQGLARPLRFYGKGEQREPLCVSGDQAEHYLRTVVCDSEEVLSCHLR